MQRRKFSTTTGSALSILFAGCLGGTDVPDNENGGENAVEERIKTCEEQYIQDEVVTRADETIDDTLQPAVVDSESRGDGEFVELRTEFGVTRQADDAPDEHIDYLVTAYYLVSDDIVYRTEGDEPEGDPRDGITIDC
ncbi:uncharacterized protein NP_6234A (plasmid) [Natronomonas pharaonis DSM 2160]|uniref:Uncharacterized protein n=1 Tax=Natronomonas pharaonis (strain ATCC 35678 / DSM 2160 / CIP 103997 / JCM 8858 / NBRC 14720 / NCIMB 2260 / Gabara) TaxID=348780 RepID=Q3ILX3_NATPD|nr:hypothetical protein [Natronomonas pharaonis]CAI50897.1 uncharacterized protein NP_6234A [Natronomonas pharaonis DSM 2160]